MDGSVFITYVRATVKDFSNPVLHETLVEQVGKGVVFAVKTDYSSGSHCFLAPSLGSKSILLTGGISGKHGSLLMVQAAWSSLSKPQAYSRVFSDFGATTGGFPQQFALGESAVFYELTAPRLVRAVGLPGLELLPAKETAEVPIAHGDRAIAIRSPGDALVVLDPHSGSSVFANAESGRVITAVAVDRSGTPAVVVWAESEAVDGAFTNPRLYSKPLSIATEKHEVASVVDVRGLGCSGLIANRGVAVWVNSEATARVIRIADGVQWEAAAEKTLGFVRPVWVDDAEVWLSTADIALPGWQAYPSGAVRLSRHSLSKP